MFSLIWFFFEVMMPFKITWWNPNPCSYSTQSSKGTSRTTQPWVTLTWSEMRILPSTSPRRTSAAWRQGFPTQPTQPSYSAGGTILAWSGPLLIICPLPHHWCLGDSPCCNCGDPYDHTFFQNLIFDTNNHNDIGKPANVASKDNYS